MGSARRVRGRSVSVKRRRRSLVSSKKRHTVYEVGRVRARQPIRIGRAYFKLMKPDVLSKTVCRPAREKRMEVLSKVRRRPRGNHTSAVNLATLALYSRYARNNPLNSHFTAPRGTVNRNVYLLIYMKTNSMPPSPMTVSSEPRFFLCFPLGPKPVRKSSTLPTYDIGAAVCCEIYHAVHLSNKHRAFAGRVHCVERRSPRVAQECGHEMHSVQASFAEQRRAECPQETSPGRVSPTLSDVVVLILAPVRVKTRQRSESLV